MVGYNGVLCNEMTDDPILMMKPMTENLRHYLEAVGNLC